MYKLFGYAAEEQSSSTDSPKTSPDTPGSPATALGYSMCADAGDFNKPEQSPASTPRTTASAEADEDIASIMGGEIEQQVVMACHSPRATSGETEAVAVIEAEQESLVQATALAEARAEADAKAAALEEALLENEALKQKLNAMHELVSGALQEVIDEAHRISPRTSSDEDTDEADTDPAATPATDAEDSQLAKAWRSLGQSLRGPYSIFGIGMGLGVSGAAYKVLATTGRSAANKREASRKIASAAATATTATTSSSALVAAARSWIPRNRVGRILTATVGTATLAAVTCAAMRWRRGQAIFAVGDGSVVLPTYCRNALATLRQLLPPRPQLIGGGTKPPPSTVATVSSVGAKMATSTAASLESTLSELGEYIKNAKPEALHAEM